MTRYHAIVTVSLFAFLGILVTLMMSIVLPTSKIAELLTWTGGYVFEFGFRCFVFAGRVL
jgi:hypothetical protein